MSNTRYSIFPISLGGTNFTQITGLSINPAANRDVITVGGSVDPAAVIINNAEPAVSFDTDDLTTVLTNVSLTAGLNCTSGGTIRFQQRDDGSTFATSSSTGVTLVTTKGFLVPTGISCSQDSAASINLQYWALYDGTNIPLVPHSAADISGVSPTFNSRFYLGPVYLNSSALDVGVQSVQINPGIAYSAIRENGDIWARTGAIVARTPTISVTILKTDYMATMGNMFLNAISSAFAVYLQKGSAGSTRVAAATTVHAKFSTSTGAWSPTAAAVNGGGDATVTLTANIVGALGFSVASAIP